MRRSRPDRSLPAGEDPIPGVDGRALYEEVVRFGHKYVQFAPDPRQIPARLGEIVRPGDIIVVLGAGNINRSSPTLSAFWREDHEPQRRICRDDAVPAERRAHPGEKPSANPRCGFSISWAFWPAWPRSSSG